MTIAKFTIGYLRDLERHYATGEQLVIRGGRVELGNPADLPFTIKRSPTRARLTRDVHPGGFVVGCNMTMHREVAAPCRPIRRTAWRGRPAASRRGHRLPGTRISAQHPSRVCARHDRLPPSRTKRTPRYREDFTEITALGNGGLYVKHIRCAPWLLRHFFWSVRSALQGTFRRPPVRS